MKAGVFETRIGWMGICWSAFGVAGVWLPEHDVATVLARIRRRHPSIADVVPTGDISHAVEALTRYCAGEPADFSGIPLDLSDADPFALSIYDAARALGYGETVTYGELAVRAGFPGKTRETGSALGRNPVPIIVPCHRILAAGNKIGGFSAPGGARTKERMLAMEGVRLGPPPSPQGSLPF